MCFVSRTTYQPISAGHWKPWKNVLYPLCGLSAASRAPRHTSSTPEGQEGPSCSKPPKHSQPRRKRPTTIDCHSLLAGTRSSPQDHSMVLLCAFRSNETKSIVFHWWQNVLRLWHAMFPDRQVRYPGELAPGKGAIVEKSVKWCPFLPLKEKNKDQIFPRLPQKCQETEPRLSRGERIC